MRIWGIAIEKCVLTIIAPDYLNRRGMFDLNAQQPLHNCGEIFDTPQPARNRPRHSRATCQETVGPPAGAGLLCKPGSHLSGANKKPPRSLYRRQIIVR